jgi:hypothetical protein
MGDVTGHLLFVPSPHGYSIEEREGEPPAPGVSVDLGEAGSFVVNRLGPSPYPDDERRCAYLLADVV